MANNSISVQTDDLLACADQYRNLANQYNTAWTTVENKLQECREYWQGSFSTDFDEVLKSVQDVRNKIYDNTTQLADFITTAVQHYIDVDRGIAQRIDESHSDADYPATVEVSIREGQCLSDIWQNWSDHSPNGYTNINGKGNCTWYADNRWSQMNPDYPLAFTGRGNAKTWGNNIDKNKFNVLSTSDTNNIQGNAIAVSQSGTYGHVAYIERVRDGMVYYTEDGEKQTRPNTWLKDANGNWVGPTVQCCTLEEFKRKFGNIITRK